MNELIKGWPVFCFLVLLTGCWDDNDDDVPAYTILVYMAADNSLDGEVDYSLKQLKEGAGKSADNVVVYLDRRHEKPRLFRISPNGEEIALKNYEEENSANASTLSDVIDETKKLVPSLHFGLVMWSHSMAWVPEGYGQTARVTSFRLNSDRPRTRYLAIDEETGGEGGAMEIKEVAAALPASTAEFILFDVCLMASVEALYEIKHTCNYVIAAPTEVLAESDRDASGMPYAEVLPFLSQGLPGLKKACQAYYDHYNALDGAYRSATISLVDMKELDDLYTVTAGVLSGTLPQAKALDVSNFRVYYTKSAAPVFFDMGDVVNALSNNAGKPAFQEQLHKTVLYKAATEKFLDVTIDPEHFSGLSMYVPLSEWSANKEYSYYFSLNWPQVYD